MSDNTSYIIGTDIGTGSAKTIRLGVYSGAVLGSFQQAYPTLHPAPGYAEQDPEALLAAVKAGIREMAAAAGGPPLAIALSSAMHSIMAVAGDDTALTPLIIWADNRSEIQALALRDTPEGINIYRQTGTPVHAMSPLCKIRWLREQQPALFAQAAMFPGIKEYILHHFFGHYITDHSIASATGLFNIATRQWSDEALTAAGIRAHQLPAPVPATHILTGLKPAVAAELGIPADTPFIVGGSDGCLAQLGSNALDTGHATITIGTSSAMRMAGLQPVTDAERRLFTYLLTDDIYITGGASNNGGVLLQWLVRDFLKQPLDNLQSLISAGLQAEAGTLICLPYLQGERAPIWNSHATAAFIGIQPQHSTEHFMRAALEGICYALRSIRDPLAATAGAIHKISVSGGFTASPGWIQLLADVFGQSMHVRQQQDASAIGAVMLAAEALKLPPIAGLQHQHEKIYTPDMDRHVVYNQRYERFIRLGEVVLKQ
ncbi:gluconokinase [Chitinophaga solisilvae]|uniref:gluconokinase n=1 Tax=Chitinophaga solisilvae TaxID=1233460 RepID=UPI0013685817|nr:gluconokinase [Chitinophaga solisilvae]